MYRKSFEDVDAYITGLTLANFKSFVEPTRIDFAPITLFFGPNSSGKSTVYSAIALLEKLLTLGYFSGWEAPELLAYIHKREDDHQAYITTHLHSDSFSHPIYAVDSKSPIDLSIDSYESLFPNKSDFLHSRIGRSGFDVDVTYSLRHKDHSYWSLEEIKFQQESLVMHRYFETKFNLNNVFFEHVEKDLARYDLSFLSLITRLFPQENTALDGNILITELEIHIDKTDVSYSEDYLDVNYINSLERKLFDVIIKTIFNLTLYHTAKACHEVLHVGPVRQIPSSSELTYHFECRKFVHKYVDKESGSTTETESRYFNTILPINPPKPAWLDGTIAWQILAEDLIDESSFRSEERLLDSVNQWLVSPQRLGLQHRLHAVIGYVISDCNKLTDTQKLSINIIAERDFPGIVVKLQLEDVNIAIPVAVNSVGVGVPQLTPVLVAGLVGNVVFIEQPELHLHPKVQTEIADFFLHCFNDRQTRFIIETHSEHLALRILRRIRETNSAHIKHRDFSITENDVAFYYFDHANGVTEVKQLRVSPNGDFLDRWPKGFFAEREAELFDEDD